MSANHNASRRKTGVNTVRRPQYAAHNIDKGTEIRKLRTIWHSAERVCFIQPGLLGTAFSFRASLVHL